MDARQAAEAIRTWAEQAGVFSQGRSAPVMPASTLLAAGMFSTRAAGIFASKPITAVGFNRSRRREPRVYVYTRRRLTASEVQALRDNGLPGPVEFRVAAPFSVTTPAMATRTPLFLRGKRIACGSSVSVGNAREAGTLGAILEAADGALFGLSCNHVTGGCSNARVETPIVTPGILDVGAGLPLPQTVGLHHRALPFVPGDPTSVDAHRANLDAAIFRIVRPNLVSSWQGTAYDTPSASEEPEEDAPVEKVGRSTGHTRGFIESQLVGPLRIDYDTVVHHSAEESVAFRGTVHFEPAYVLRGPTSGFAREGDSGSLVVHRPDPDAPPTAAVGLVIGGRGAETTYMLPLRPVLDALGLRLASGLG